MSWSKDRHLGKRYALNLLEDTDRFMKIPVTTVDTAQPSGGDSDAHRASIQNDLGVICQACGLCCSGVLFTDVDLTVGEAKTLQAKKPANPIPDKPIVAMTRATQQNNESGDALAEGAGKLVEYGIDQPCQFLSGTACSIYSDRPRKCRDFECALLEKVQKKQLSINEGLAVVSVAKQHVANIEASFPSWMTFEKTVAVSGLRAKLYAFKKALTIRHIQLAQGDNQTALAEDYRVTYHILNYLRFMAEYFHKSSLLKAYEKLLRAQTFTAPPVAESIGKRAHDAG